MEGRHPEDDPLEPPGDDEGPLRMDGDGRVRGAERARVGEVHGGVLAIEQFGLRDEEDSRAGRAQHCAALVHGAQPLDQARIAPFLPAFRRQQNGWHDHDVARLDIADGALHRERHAAREGERPDRLAHDLHLERRASRAAVQQRRAFHHVEQPGDRGHDRVGQRH